MNKCDDCKATGTVGYPNKWREEWQIYICSRCNRLRKKEVK